MGWTGCGSRRAGRGLAILVGGTSLFAVFAPYWLHRWVWRHRREAQLARLIARRFPGLGDRLLGVIELQDQHESVDSLSPRLRGAAMEAVAAEAGRRKLDEALPPPRHLRWGLALLVLAGGAAAVLTLTPRAGMNALKRWLMPLANTERYTFTRLEKPPAYLAVPYGEAFDVALRLVRGHRATGRSRASGRYGLQPAVGRSWKVRLPVFVSGQQEPGTVVFRSGDAVHTMKVEPLQRPFVQGGGRLVTPPAYLHIPGQTLDLSNGVLNAVEGSRSKSSSPPTARWQRPATARPRRCSRKLRPGPRAEPASGDPAPNGTPKDDKDQSAAKPPAGAAQPYTPLAGNSPTVATSRSRRSLKSARWRLKFRLRGRTNTG